LTGTVYTIDENDADAPTTNWFGIVGGDPVDLTLDTIVNTEVSFAAPGS
jgi:hypothetical protein